MTWTRPTIQTIYDRIKADMESRVTSDVKIPRVSLLGIMDHVFTGSEHLSYGFLEWLSKQVFVSTATIWGLTRWGNILNIPRKAAQYAQFDLVFTGTAVSPIVAGTVVVNGDGYEYITQADFTIGGDPVQADASEAGAEYNTDDTTMELSSPLTDVDSVVQVDDTVQAGADLETLESWVLRLLQRFQNPPSSGSATDYERWALSRPGVGRSWCYPSETWQGDGSVGVYVATDTLAAVSAAVLSDVETYIEIVRPIPALVDYLNINPVGVYYYLTMTPLTTALQNQVRENLSNLHIAESDPGGTVLLSHIRQAIMSAGPDDFMIQDIALGGGYGSIGADDITVNHPDISVFQSVNFQGM